MFPDRGLPRTARTLMGVVSQQPGMTRSRAALDTDSLLKIVLLLVVVWLVLEIVETIVGTLASILGVFKPVIGIVLVVLIVLWLLDRI